MTKEMKSILFKIEGIKTNSNSAKSYLRKAIENINDAIEEDTAYVNISQRRR